MILAAVRSGRLVGRHPLQSAGVFGVMFLMLVLLKVTYYWTAPGISGVSPLALVLAFAVGQGYLLIRWALRIARYGAELDLYDRWAGPRLGRGAALD